MRGLESQAQEALITKRRCAERQPGGSADARDHGWGSEIVTSVIGGVGRGDAGSCSDGGIDVRQGVASLVANGDGADAGVAPGSRSSSCRRELQHGAGGRTRRRSFAIGTATVIVILGSGIAQRMRAPVWHSATTMCGWTEGRLSQSDGTRPQRSGDGLPKGKRGRSAEARDRGWRSALVSTVIASVGRDVAALVAIGDGADAGPAHRMRGSSRGGEVRHGRGGRTRGRAIVVAADDAARSRRREVRLRADLMEGIALRGERPSTVRSTGTDAMPGWRRERTSPSYLRAAVPARSRRQVRDVAREPVDGEAVAGDAAMRMGTARRSPSPAEQSVPVLRDERPSTVRSTGRDAMPSPRRGGMSVRARAAQARMRRAAMRSGGHGEKMWRRPSPKRGPPPTGEASVAVMPSASPVSPTCEPCRRGCR